MIGEVEIEGDTLDQEMINVLSKIKLPLAELGSTPKKAQGSPAKFPHTEEKIGILANKLKYHIVSAWATIDLSQRDLITGVVEQITELRQIADDLQKNVTARPPSQATVTPAGTSTGAPKVGVVRQPF